MKYPPSHTFQVNPHLGHVEGLRPANSARSPIGNKQTLTTISQAGNPPRSVNVLHLGHEIEAIDSSKYQFMNPHGEQTG